MNGNLRRAMVCMVLGLAGCGGGDRADDGPVDIDYSSLRIVEARDGALQYAGDPDRVLRALQNGVRLSLREDVVIALSAVPTAPGAVSQPAYSSTTVQVDGVEEEDLVKYDGRHIYALRTESTPSLPTVPGTFRNVLKIARTDPATANHTVVSEFTLEGNDQTQTLMYQVRNEAGAADYLATVSQAVHWPLPPLPQVTLLAQPDRTIVQLLDVRDPYNVSQAWKLELDGWLKASRKIGDTLYLVTSFRPRLADLVYPATSIPQREANERRIRSAGEAELMPVYRENDGARRQLARPGDCVIATDLRSNEAFMDLVLVTAVNLSERRVTDSNCLSTDINGVFVAPQSLYVGGTGQFDGGDCTVLHKFALGAGDIEYRASGVVAGHIGWNNPAYFMDEYQDDLRIVTSDHVLSGSLRHRLSVLRETPARRLGVLATLPNAARPAPIGKPGEQVRAVRFFGDRGYLVTARTVDPLYVLDLADPVDPYIAGELELPGFATYLRPVGPPESQLLLSVGQTSPTGIIEGVKVELFDVSDIDTPRSVGVQIFGERGSRSDANGDPHALTFLTLPGDGHRHRLALPIDVFDTPDPNEPGQFRWSYSGLHLLEIDAGDAPQLRLQGVITTAQPDGPTAYPPYVTNRGVLHDDSVFVVGGDSITGSLWEDVHEH